MKSPVFLGDLWSKINLTIACYFSYFVVGTVTAFIFTLSLDADGEDASENLNFGMSIRSGALTLGFIVNGFAFTRANKQIGAICALLLIPVSVVPIVLKENGILLYISQAFLGFILSMFEVCVNSLMLDLWMGQVTSPSLLQKLHFIHDLGTLLAPFTANFILTRSSLYADEPHNSLPKVTFFVLTLAAPAIFSALIHAVLFLVELRTSKNVNKVLTSQPVASSFMFHSRIDVAQNDTQVAVAPDFKEDKELEAQVTWKSFFISGLILFFFSGSNQAVFNYGPLVSQRPSDFGTIAQTHLLMNVSSAVAKVLAGFACIFVSTSILSFFSLALSFISLPLFYVFGNSSTTYLQTGSVLFGCTSGVFPQLVISTMDHRKHLTTSAVGLLSFSKNAGSFGFSLLSVVLSKSFTSHPVSAFTSLTAVLVLLLLFSRKNW